MDRTPFAKGDQEFYKTSLEVEYTEEKKERSTEERLALGYRVQRQTKQALGSLVGRLKSVWRTGLNGVFVACAPLGAMKANANGDEEQELDALFRYHIRSFIT